MKKTLAITFALTSAIIVANAQDFGLVSGYSFNGITVSSASDAVAADKSDFAPDASVNSSVSSFQFLGDIGSGEQDLFPVGAAGVAWNTFPGGLSSSTDIITRPFSQDFVNNDDFLQITNSNGFVTAFEITVDTAGLGELGFEGWQVEFAAGGDTTIDWSYSVDGGAFADIADTVVVGADAGYSFDITDAASTLVLRGAFTPDFAPSESLQLDNLAIYGTSVPEPSTYAAIAGAFALGFVAYRRARK